jgi:hypothetical protein
VASNGIIFILNLVNIDEVTVKKRKKTHMYECAHIEHGDLVSLHILLSKRNV